MKRRKVTYKLKQKNNNTKNSFKKFGNNLNNNFICLIKSMNIVNKNNGYSLQNRIFNKLQQKISQTRKICQTLDNSLNDINNLFSLLCEQDNNENPINISPGNESKEHKDLRHRKVKMVKPMINGQLIYTQPMIQLNRISTTLPRNIDNSNDSNQENYPPPLREDKNTTPDTNRKLIENLPVVRVYLPRLPLSIIQSYSSSNKRGEQEEEETEVKETKEKPKKNLNADIKLKTPVVPLRDIRFFLNSSTISLEIFERKQKHWDFINSLLKEDPLEGPSWKFNSLKKN